MKTIGFYIVILTQLFSLYYFENVTQIPNTSPPNLLHKPNNQIQENPPDELSINHEKSETFNRGFDSFKSNKDHTKKQLNEQKDTNQNKQEATLTNFPLIEETKRKVLELNNDDSHNMEQAHNVQNKPPNNQEQSSTTLSEDEETVKDSEEELTSGGLFETLGLSFKIVSDGKEIASVVIDDDDKMVDAGVETDPTEYETLWEDLDSVANMPGHKISSLMSRVELENIFMNPYNIVRNRLLLSNQNKDDILSTKEQFNEWLKVPGNEATYIRELQDLYETAQSMYNQEQRNLKRRQSGLGPDPNYVSHYMVLTQQYEYVPALEDLAYAYLFGRSVPQNITHARILFEELSEKKGSPKAQMALGFLYATGIAFANQPSSQSKALVYYTFAALGSNPFALMALGYRHKYGYTLTESCESALSYYSRVARIVARDGRDSRAIDNPGVIQRIRLLDLAEPPQTPPAVTINNAEGSDTSVTSSSEGSSSSHGSGSASNVNPILDKDIIKYYKFLADNGDTQSQVGLGQLLYQGGRGVIPNPKQAYTLFLRAAHANPPNAFAQAFLGKMYLEGIGDDNYLLPDNQTAYTYFSLSAQAKNPMGQNGLGIMHLLGYTINKTQTALAHEKMARHHRTFITNNVLGDKDNYNNNQPKKPSSGKNSINPEEKMGAGKRRDLGFLSALVKKLKSRILRKSTSASSTKTSTTSGQAKNELSVTDLIKQDPNYAKMSSIEIYQPQPNKAYQYFKLAADQGYPEAFLHLANMHFTGNGARLNYRTALKYYNLASQAGNLLALYNLGQMHAMGIGIRRSCFTAMELFKNVAERGSWGKMLMEAFNAYQAKRYDTALILYLFLAEMGYETAQSNAAYILENEPITLFPKNESLLRAFVLYKRAAIQGYHGARIKLGDFYYYGYNEPEGIPDYEAAIHNYRTAYEFQKSARAAFNLAFMHEKGLGLKKDLKLAKRYYDMAFQASPDAYVPVTLALLKLSYLIYYEKLKQMDIESVLASGYELIAHYIPEDWDLHLIVLCAFLLGTLMYFRRGVGGVGGQQNIRIAQQNLLPRP